VTEATRALVERYVADVLNGPDPAAACRALLTPDFRFTGPGNEGGLVGPDAFAAIQDAMRAALEGLRFGVEQAVVDGPDAALVLRMTGRHVAPFAGVEPAGAAVDLLLVDILRIRDGRIAAITAYLDSAALRRQLLVPAAMG
jgi:predicted ester cyclase